MSENRETIDEITEKMSNYTNKCNDGHRTEYHVVIEDMKGFAERINEARKREAINGAKMYKALEQIAKLMDRILVSTELDDKIHRIALEAQNMADGVLLLSPRNCDVGTAEEQIGRHNKYCQYLKDFAARYNINLDICIKYDCRHCFAKWSQLPYEEGGVK